MSKFWKRFPDLKEIMNKHVFILRQLFSKNFEEEICSSVLMNNA